MGSAFKDIVPLIDTCRLVRDEFIYLVSEGKLTFVTASELISNEAA